MELPERGEHSSIESINGSEKDFTGMAKVRSLRNVSLIQALKNREEDED